MDTLYRDNILDHFQNPRHKGKLSKITISHEEQNIFCGDLIRMEFLLENDKIKDVSFSGKGCAISLAATSMLTDVIIKKKIVKILNMPHNILLALLGISLSPTRLKCALLPWQVMHNALRKYQSKYDKI